MDEAYRLVGYTRDRAPRNKRPNFTDEALLDGIRRLHAQHGYVTISIIHADRLLPAAKIFHGSLWKHIGRLHGRGVPRHEVRAISASRKRACARLKAQEQDKGAAQLT